MVIHGMILGAPGSTTGFVSQNSPARCISPMGVILPKSVHAEFAALERLQGKGRLHQLSPKTRLVAAMRYECPLVFGLAHVSGGSLWKERRISACIRNKPVSIAVARRSRQKRDARRWTSFC